MKTSSTRSTDHQCQYWIERCDEQSCKPTLNRQWPKLEFQNLEKEFHQTSVCFDWVFYPVNLQVFEFLFLNSELTFFFFQFSQINFRYFLCFFFHIIFSEVFFRFFSKNFLHVHSSYSKHHIVILIANCSTSSSLWIKSH